jgi:hypothetical protein
LKPALIAGNESARRYNPPTNVITPAIIAVAVVNILVTSTGIFHSPPFYCEHYLKRNILARIPTAAIVSKTPRIITAVVCTSDCIPVNVSAVTKGV